MQDEMVHPAWRAVHGKLLDRKRWAAWEAGEEGAYHDWEIALAMTVAGFGDDVAVTARDKDGRPAAYALPPYTIPRDDEDDDKRPIDAAIPLWALAEYFERQHRMEFYAYADGDQPNLWNE